MALEDFLKEIDEEVKTVNSSGFEVEIIETNFVPSFSDPKLAAGIFRLTFGCGSSSFTHLGGATGLLSLLYLHPELVS